MVPPNCVHYFKYVSSWCLFFDPRQTAHQSNIGVRLQKETEYHLHTLCKDCHDHVFQYLPVVTEWKETSNASSIELQR
jgi:hypothetical protein